MENCAVIIKKKCEEVISLDKNGPKITSKIECECFFFNIGSFIIL